MKTFLPLQVKMVKFDYMVNDTKVQRIMSETEYLKLIEALSYFEQTITDIKHFETTTLYEDNSRTKSIGNIQFK